MKFLPVVLFLGARCGRPSSHGVLFSTDTRGEAPLQEKRECYPQNSQIDEDWKTECITEEECCSKTIQQSATMSNGRYVFVCGCISAGKPFAHSKSDCCSGDAFANGTCKCINPDIGSQHHLSKRMLELNETDCCYESAIVPEEGQRPGFPVGAFHKCGPRPCQQPGDIPAKFGWQIPLTFWQLISQSLPSITTMKCCGFEPTDTLDPCKCIPAGREVDERYETVEETHCCSGSYVESGEGSTEGPAASKYTCGCLPEHRPVPVELGATEDDCCTGGIIEKEGRKYCQAKTCIRPRHRKNGGKGDFCCTDDRDGATLRNYSTHLSSGNDKHFCPCVTGGTPVAPHHADLCCSKRIRDGKCEFLSWGEKISLSFMNQDECFSGKAEYGRCLCMEPGSNRRGEIEFRDYYECCSAQLNKEGKRCGCIANGNRFRTGGKVEYCCSGLAQAGRKEICGCGPIGVKFKEADGMKADADCCSHAARGGFCACVLPGKKPLKPAHCCGALNGTQCGCKRTGSSVPRGADKNVCCSGEMKKSDTHCNFNVCL